MGEVPEGLGEIPGSEGVRRVARVHERDRRCHGRIGEIRQERLDLRAHGHARVDKGAAGETRKIGEARSLESQVLETTANDVELPLEVVGVDGARCRRRVPSANEDLAHEGHAVSREPTDRLGVVRNVTPPENSLPFLRG